MMEWPNSTHLKVHENCGGRVEWREDQRSGIEYSGHCHECGATRLPVEDIIPIDLPTGTTAGDLYESLDADSIVDWEWPTGTSYEDVQIEIRRRFTPEH